MHVHLSSGGSGCDLVDALWKSVRKHLATHGGKKLNLKTWRKLEPDDLFETVLPAGKSFKIKRKKEKKSDPFFQEISLSSCHLTTAYNTDTVKASDVEITVR